jgi:hypothetical protein
MQKQQKQHNLFLGLFLNKNRKRHILNLLVNLKDLFLKKELGHFYPQETLVFYGAITRSFYGSGERSRNNHRRRCFCYEFPFRSKKLNEIITQALDASVILVSSAIGKTSLAVCSEVEIEAQDYFEIKIKSGELCY